jgi:membrane-bound ClpP family serine protease
MTQDEGIRNTKKVIWGVFLIALGVLFLFERFVPWGFAGLGEWWPLIFIVIGVTHLVERRVGSALTMFLMGAWFLAVTSGWMGLSYANSWPLVLIAVGAGIVVKALTGEGRGHGLPKWGQ